MSSFLSPEFLAQYEGKRPSNAGVLFEITHLNKYSWWLEDKGRRETWTETVKRVVDYSISLYQGPAGEDELKAEAELMFSKMWELESLPAGRTMRIGGTPACIKFPEMNFNCAFLVISSWRDLIDLFHMSLCSVGIGYRVMKEDIDQMERFCQEVFVTHEDYKYNAFGVESTSNVFLGYQGKYPAFKLTIGDSKEGWVKALEVFMGLSQRHSNESNGIIWQINYDNVRPEGTRIKTAGGFAAGPQGMQEMFTRLAQIINNSQGKFSPTDAMDLANIIAKNVVTGGNRRAAQIALGSPDDEEFVTAKLNLYTQIEGKWKVDPNLEHRKMSNNSVVFTETPTKEQLRDIFQRIRNNGEPGFFNLNSAGKRRPNANGLNPCGEVILDNKGVCNLSTVNMKAHLKDNGQVDYSKLAESVRLATRIGMRQTNVTLSLPEWDKVQKRDRLIGPSLTGYDDFMSQLNPCEDIHVILRLMNTWANEESIEYAHEMRIPAPLLVTVLKPEGTISQLPTVASGLHRAFAPYYFRRMSVSKSDPLNAALKSIGVRWEKDIRQEESSRDLFVFPVKTEATVAAYDESAVAQLDRYFMMQRFYTDHNSSCTIYVGSGYDGYEDEWESVIDKIHDRWNEVVAIAFLPKHSLSNPPFPQMPYETTDKETFEEWNSNFPHEQMASLNEIVSQFETDRQEYEEANDGCSSGVCPTA